LLEALLVAEVEEGVGGWGRHVGFARAVLYARGGRQAKTTEQEGVGGIWSD
jgi:hypothetical protein